ncbi:MAG: 5-oxoprolinase subunit PxpB [Bacillota bacterium]|nr:allophanate hydrolase [Bacillota bacterium]
MNLQARCVPAGDTCLIMEFGGEINPELHYRVRSLMLALEAHPVPGIVELVPAYCSLTVHYDPLLTTFRQITGQIKIVAETLGAHKLPAARLIDIPVVYGGDYGPDLEFVAGQRGMSTEEVIARHTSRDYLVYMLGFIPGFPYLGGLDERIAVPRLDKPRAHIPAGSVGIAGKQTGIYPLDSPGGWRLIGRTPLVLFDAAAAEPVLLRPGDHLRFRAVSPAEYEEIRRQVRDGTYSLAVTPRA